MRQIGFDDVLLAMYGAAQDPGRWSEALTLAADHLGAIGGLLTRHTYAKGGDFIMVGRLDPELTGLYIERHADNGYARGIQWRPEGDPVLASSLWPHTEARRSALYAEILLPQGIEDHLMLNYGPWGGSNGSGGLAFCLDARAADAPGEALRRFTRLAPHFRQALDLAGALQASRAAERGLAAALDATPLAVMLLDSGGRLRHANLAGEALLRLSDGLRLLPEQGGPGRLATTLPAEARRLHQLIGRAVAAGLGGRMRVSRPSGEPGWPLLVTPLPMATEAAGRPVVAVLAGGPGTPPEAEVLRAAFDLTQAEARVLRCIATGIGVPGAAAALGLSAETVRSHLNRCFDATGARSQAALAALVARLPGISGPG
ncbi:LuxR C-terminal-related transcriptional regulator [Belnapia sp. F-4-1]|uniref:LuxR C-terminal-related transcriptional regulator n=1 Tax=Belnapia sp. F-4-1 TaxID=1545443 RepID=UPI0005BD1612|nr:LuxR C-terminal-related transcriptional regulator [Belnapia sp. F-4-1]